MLLLDFFTAGAASADLAAGVAGVAAAGLAGMAAAGAGAVAVTGLAGAGAAAVCAKVVAEAAISATAIKDDLNNLSPERQKCLSNKRCNRIWR